MTKNNDIYVYNYLYCEIYKYVLSQIWIYIGLYEFVE